MATCELWLLVDDCGDWEMGASQDEALTRYEDHIQPYHEAGAVRWVKVTVDVPAARILEVAAAVPEDGGEATLSTAPAGWQSVEA